MTVQKSKTSIVVYTLVGILLLMGNCQKDIMPRVDTSGINNITEDNAVAGGKIVSDIGSITQRGICLSETNPIPTVDDERIKSSSTNAAYSIELAGLKSNTTYYVRAFAINKHGTGYGQVQQFTTRKGWRKLNIASNSWFSCIDFIDANAGWICGGEYVYRTNDGGNLWTEKNIGVSGASINSIHFVDEVNGYLVGRDGLVMKTDDGGSTWVELNSFTNEHLKEVHFTSISSGYVLCDKHIYKTTDGGNSWGTLFTISSTWYDFTSFHFISSAEVYILYSNGEEIRTHDAFVTSVYTQGFAMPGETLTSIFHTSKEAYLVGGDWNAGKAWKTKGGNYEWYDMDLGSSVSALYDVKFYDEKKGYIVGRGGTVLRTVDGGMSWIKVNAGITNSLFAVACPDENIVYAVGDGGTILKYE